MAKPAVSQKKVGIVMREFYAGGLHSGGGGKVKSVDQAKAIAMSEGRKAASGRKRSKNSHSG